MATPRLRSLKQQKVRGPPSAQDIVGTLHLLNLQFCLNDEGSKILGELAGLLHWGKSQCLIAVEHIVYKLIRNANRLKTAS